MIPKRIIEKAIEGGWHFSCDVPGEVVQYGEVMVAYTMWHEVALDPTFWQALGKALGWSPQGNYKFADHPELAHMTCGEIQEARPFARAHRFYDLILTGQPTDPFWAELLQ